LSRLPRYWRIPSDFLQDSSDNNLIYLIQVDQTGSSSELSEELEKLKTSTQQLQSNFDEALKQTREQLKQLRGSTVGAAKEGDLIELRETQLRRVDPRAPRSEERVGSGPNLICWFTFCFFE
jgi:hypothetical protein